MSDSLSGPSPLAQGTGSEEGKKQQQPKAAEAPAAAPRDNSLQGLAGHVQELGQEVAAAHSQPLPEVPAPMAVPPPPKFKEPNPVQAFGSIGSMIAIFGSLLARRPLVTAFNGLAGAVKAYQQNDVLRYKIGMEQWKTNSQYAIDVTKQMSSVYHNILDSRKMTDKEKMDEMSIAAHAFQDQLGIANLAERSMAAAQAHADRVANMAQRAELAQQRLSFDERLLSARLMPQQVAAQAANEIHALTGTGTYEGKPHDVEFGGYKFTPKDFTSYMNLVKSNPTLEGLQTDMANSSDVAEQNMLLAKIMGVKLSSGATLTPKQKAMAMLFAQAAKSPDGFKVLGEDLPGIEKPLPMAQTEQLPASGTTGKAKAPAQAAPPKAKQGNAEGSALPPKASLQMGKYYWIRGHGWMLWDGRRFFTPERTTTLGELGNAISGGASAVGRAIGTVVPPYHPPASWNLNRYISGQ